MSGLLIVIPFLITQMVVRKRRNEGENAHKVLVPHQDLSHGHVLLCGVDRPLPDQQARRTQVLLPLLLPRLLVKLNVLGQWNPLLQHLHLHQREIVIIHRNVEDTGLIVIDLTGVIIMNEVLNLLLDIGQDGVMMTITMEKGRDDTTAKDTKGNGRRGTVTTMNATRKERTPLHQLTNDIVTATNHQTPKICPPSPNEMKFPRPSTMTAIRNTLIANVRDDIRIAATVIAQKNPHIPDMSRHILTTSIQTGMHGRRRILGGEAFIMKMTWRRLLVKPRGKEIESVGVRMVLCCLGRRIGTY